MPKTFKPEPAVEKEWERPAETAAVIGISLPEIYTAIRDGRLEAVKWGKATLVNIESRRRLMASLPKAQGNLLPSPQRAVPKKAGAS
jgi:hypothetical protein